MANGCSVSTFILGLRASNSSSPQSKRVAHCSFYSSSDVSSIRKVDTTNVIEKSGVVACLRAPSAELAYEAASAALRGGILALEITIGTPGVFEVLNRLVLQYPHCALGIGTVLNAKDAKKAASVGAKFIMSPATVPEIMDDDMELLYIPGAMTPTEILSVHKSGAKIVKVYPVSALGGVKYIAAMKKSFPFIPLVASQVGDFISNGASAVVLSDAIFSKAALDRKDFCAVSHCATIASRIGKEAVLQRNNGRP